MYVYPKRSKCVHKLSIFSASHIATVKTAQNLISIFSFNCQWKVHSLGHLPFLIKVKLLQRKINAVFAYNICWSSKFTADELKLATYHTDTTELPTALVTATATCSTTQYVKLPRTHTHTHTHTHTESTHTHTESTHTHTQKAHTSKLWYYHVTCTIHQHRTYCRTWFRNRVPVTNPAWYLYICLSVSLYLLTFLIIALFDWDCRRTDWQTAELDLLWTSVANARRL